MGFVGPFKKGDRPLCPLKICFGRLRDCGLGTEWSVPFFEQAMRLVPVFRMNAPPKLRAAVSCGFNGNQFVLDVVQLYHPRAFFRVLKVWREDVPAKLVPGIRLCEYGVPEHAGAIAALFGIANFENQVRSVRVPEPGGPRYTARGVHRARSMAKDEQGPGSYGIRGSFQKRGQTALSTEDMLWTFAGLWVGDRVVSPLS